MSIELSFAFVFENKIRQKRRTGDEYSSENRGRAGLSVDRIFEKASGKRFMRRW